MSKTCERCGNPLPTMGRGQGRRRYCADCAYIVNKYNCTPQGRSEARERTIAKRKAMRDKNEQSEKR